MQPGRGLGPGITGEAENGSGDVSVPPTKIRRHLDAADGKAAQNAAKDEDPKVPIGLTILNDAKNYTRIANKMVETERALHHRITPLPQAEQALWVLDAAINDRGLYLAAIHIAESAQREIDAELLKITEGLVGTSNQTAKLIAWLGAHGCEVSDVQRQTLQNVLTRKGISPEARHVIELRLDGAHAAAAKLSAMRNWLNPDGRVRGALKYHGASTGRWTSFGIQLQNLKRPAENMERAIETVANRRSRSIAPALPATDVGHRVSRQKIT